MFYWVIIVCLLLSAASAIPLTNFYPFGTAQGDQQLLSNDDRSTPAITLNVSFPFFGTDYGTIFVSFKSSSTVSYAKYGTSVNVMHIIICARSGNELVYETV